MSHAFDADCIFCKIIAGEIPSEMLAQTPDAVAFRDINPAAAVHVLIVPRTHVENAAALAAAEPATLSAMVTLADELAAEHGLDGGYRLVFNTGPDGGQTVFHAHLHLLGGALTGMLA